MNPRKPLVWPPKVGERIHLDTGHDHNSWSAEVRAVVDDDYAVVKRWRKHKGWHVYEILDRLHVEVFNKNGEVPMFYFGPLPKRAALTKGPVR